MVGEQDRQPELLRASSESGVVVINGRCRVRTEGGHSVVQGPGGLVLGHYAAQDSMGKAHAMVSLVEQGWASQREVSDAFGISTRTVRRQIARYEAGGLAALGRPGGYPKGRPRLMRSRTRLISRLKAEGRSNREIGERVGVNEKAVRKQLRRLGWTVAEAVQPELGLRVPSVAPAADPNVSASANVADGDTRSPAITAAKPDELGAAAADPNVSASANVADGDTRSPAITAAKPDELGAAAADPNVSASTSLADGDARSPAITAAKPDELGAAAADPNVSASANVADGDARSPAITVAEGDKPAVEGTLLAVVVPDAGPSVPASAGGAHATADPPTGTTEASDPAPSGSASPNAPGSGPTSTLTETADATAEADPNVFASAEPLPISLDTDPFDRRLDRFLACMGLLDDAAPMFATSKRVPRAGVLLALPALLASGVFECTREVYGSIGPAFYGLRTTIVALLLLALLRIKRPESLKEHSPTDLGHILGLDRAPEVKTLRRKLTRLAASRRAVELGRALAVQRAAVRGDALGFLYVDGHVRVYHGKRTIPKAHVTQMRIALPATTDYWVNDINGDPLFVITAQANAGLVKMLPVVLDEIRLIVPERRITIVFDRGGWSPKLFKKLIADGFDILTYRKGRSRRVPARSFREHKADIDGRSITYRLADQQIRLLHGALRLRQVTRLSDDGHQTPIVTSRRDLPAIEIAYRMFERWRQENFFKYLNEEYALDALVDYDVEPDDPARDVPNPVWKALTAELKKARARLAVLQAHYGLEAFANLEQLRRTMRGFKIANADLGHDIYAAMKKCVDLEAKRAKVPKRVPVEQVAGPNVIKLDTERKHLTNLIKMVAFQAESDLVALLAPHYARVQEEGRTLLQTALSSAADIDVSETELRITLAPLSSSHRSLAIAKLCEDLNAAAAVFPGTHLRLRYAVAPPQ